MASSKVDFKKNSYWKNLISPRRGNLIIFVAIYSTPQQNSLTTSWQIHFGLRNWRKSSRQKLVAKVVKPELKYFFRWIKELTTFSAV